MVRRWSYINNVNDFGPSSFGIAKKAKFDTTINTTMYLRKDYALSTILTRGRWSRRKHIHNWLPVANVLKDWARLYRFYRTYSKFTFSQYLTRHSFIALNMVSARNSIPCLNSGAEELIVGPVTRRLLNYFSHYSNPRLKFLGSFKHTLIALVSYHPNYLNEESLQSHFAVVPLLADHITETEPLNFSEQPNTGLTVNVASQLFDIFFTTWLAHLKFIYKTCVMLTYYRSNR